MEQIDVTSPEYLETAPEDKKVAILLLMKMGESKEYINAFIDHCDKWIASGKTLPIPKELMRKK